MKLLNRFYYSIRNLWYWKPRQITMEESYYLRKIAKDDPKRTGTELLLFTVGLRVVENPGELNGIYLTTIQREAVGQAKERGYCAGLG